MSKIKEMKARLIESGLRGLKEEQGSYSDWTLVQVKEECLDRNIASRASKEELVRRLEAYDNGETVPRGNGRRRSKSPAAKSKSPAKQDASPRMQTRSSSRSPRRRSARALAAAANERQDDEKEEIEFGGPLGAAFIMIMSHATLYYLWISWKFYDSNLVYPSGLGDLGAFFGRMWGHISTHAVPNTEAIAVYWTFIGAQAFFAWIIPGLKMRGLPIRHLGGIRLEYNCNGIYTWYLTLIAMAGLHFGGIWSLASVYHNFGPLMTTAILTQDLISVVVYIVTLIQGTAHRMSGNHIYDFFMGASLNPRLGSLDLKMWAEVREAWGLLFFLTCAAAAHQYEAYGVVTWQMKFMIFAHFLYTNACHKGEECIPTTWDIFHEKWGWMLIFWNGAGVPYVYCFQSWFIATHKPESIALHPYFVGFMFAWLVVAYYFWDVVQRQRNSFRMKLNGSFVARSTFPQLPGGIMDPATCSYIETETGSKLLTDGLWRYARKLHYTCDVAMALSWGLICGFTHVLPYFYVMFFLLMITHRTTRDLARCERKYGDDWVRYKQAVPWLFIPYVF